MERLFLLLSVLICAGLASLNRIYYITLFMLGVLSLGWSFCLSVLVGLMWTGMMFTEDPPEFLRCSCDIRNDNAIMFVSSSLPALDLLKVLTKVQLGLPKSFKGSPDVLLSLLLRCVLLSPRKADCLPNILKWKLLSTACIWSVNVSNLPCSDFDWGVVHIPEPVARSSSSEVKQSPSLNVFHVVVGYIWQAHATAVLLSAETFSVLELGGCQTEVKQGTHVLWGKVGSAGQCAVL